MKQQLRLFAACTVLGAMAVACDKATESVPSGTSEQISVTASVGEITRATTVGRNTTFAPGDGIAVYGWTDDVSAVATDRMVVNGTVNTLSADGSEWEPSTQMLWRDMVSSHYFLGVYPARQVTDFITDAYTLDVADQEKSDLLVATYTNNGKGMKATDGTVPLIFSHMMAKFQLTLSFRSQFGGTPTVESVACKARGTATVDYLLKAITATGDLADILLPTVTPNTAFTSVMIPQEGFDTVMIVIDGQTFTYRHTESIKLEQGKITTLHLIVGRDTITLGSVGIDDWELGTDLPDGEAL